MRKHFSDRELLQLFIGYRVETTLGKGILHQVFNDRARVALAKSPDAMATLELSQINPAAGAQCLLPRVPVPDNPFFQSARRP